MVKGKIALIRIIYNGKQIAPGIHYTFLIMLFDSDRKVHQYVPNALKEENFIYDTTNNTSVSNRELGKKEKL